MTVNDWLLDAFANSPVMKCRHTNCQQQPVYCYIWRTGTDGDVTAATLLMSHEAGYKCRKIKAINQ